MRAPPVAARSLFVAATILVAAYVTLLVLDPRAIFQSNLFILMYPLLGVTMCLLGANTQSPETRPSWQLFGCGLLILAVGQLGLTYYDFGSPIQTQTEAINSDFFFFAYGIPVMLAMCSRSTDAGLKIFAWLDGAQALIAAMLAYLQLFSVLPSHARPEAISATNLTHLNNAENLILVGTVTLRFLSNPSPARRSFYRILSLYLWVNVIAVIILGHLELKAGRHNGVQDAAWGIAYLAPMGSFALQQHKTPTDKTEPSSGQRTIGLLMSSKVIEQMMTATFQVAMESLEPGDCSSPGFPGRPVEALAPTLIGAMRARDARRKGSFHDRDRFKAPHNSTPVATLLARG